MRYIFGVRRNRGCLMRTRTAAIGCALALLASACGSRLSDEQLAAGAGTNGGAVNTAGTSPSTPGNGESAGPMFGDLPSPCGPAPEGFVATASEQGVTETSIKIGVVSDKAAVVKVPTASIEESVQAFVTYCNDLGGINGRKLELAKYDSKLGDTKAAVESACNDGLFAIVGSGSVFDDLGAQASVDCGLPDIAGYTATATKTLAPNVMTPLPNPPSSLAIGPARYLAEVLGPDVIANSAVVSSSQVDTAWVQALRVQEGWATVGYNFTVVEDTLIFEESYAPVAQKMKSAGVRFVTMVSTTSETAKLLRDMGTQGFTPDAVLLGAQYYDPELLTEPTSEGVYVELNTIPFEEADSNPAMKQFMDIYAATKTKTLATGLGVQSFSAALMFATAAKAAGADLTREALFEQIEQIHSWTGGGLHFETDPGAEARSDCYLIVQVQDGKFVRVSPPEPGTFACDPANTVELTKNNGSGVGS